MKHRFENHDLITGGASRLGVSQLIFFCELDRSRSRKVFIQVIGE